MVVNGWMAGAMFALLAACTGTPGADLGETCSNHDDCAHSAQCFHDVCAPRCVSHEDCGGGYVCEQDGTCEQVVSQVGDPCDREIDCGPRQSCQLDDADHNGDGWLAATCQPELNGNIAGTSCGANRECGTGICSLGRCSEVCSADDDCSTSFDCVDIPRLLPDDTPLFRGCLQANGRLELAISPSEAGAPIRVPVPSNALSFSVTAQVEDPRLLVGARRVEAPDGELLYSSETDEGVDNVIRYRPQKHISTLLIPNAPQVPVAVGAYTMIIRATRDVAAPDDVEIPDIRVVYKLGGEFASSILDVNLYFLDLADHPCNIAIDGGVLDAATAASSSQFQQYLVALQTALEDSGVTIGAITYQDLTGRPDLDALDVAQGSRELGTLLAESTVDGGVNVFFVRSIDPIGIQALSGGTPAPAGIAGTPASGVAVSFETMCYRSWSELARSTGHAIGSQLGLYRNVEPDGTDDAIVDSPSDGTNLMHFSEFAGTAVSQGQAEILRRNPVTR